MSKKESKNKSTKKKAPKKKSKTPGRSRIKATPGGEPFHVVRRKDGTFKDWVKISRSIAQDPLIASPEIVFPY